MLVRQIVEEEVLRTCEVFNIAFEFTTTKEEVSLEKLNQIKTNSMTREEVYYKDKWAAFDEQGNMMGYLGGFPAPIRFDGHETTCTCIGGVSTLPQYRGKGVIANCFKEHLKDSYRNGHVFSYLYPFSSAFYRQFGYELCSEKAIWDFEMTTLRRDKNVKGTIELNEKGSCYDAIAEVYGRYMQNHNLSFVREACDWKKIICDEPALQGKYTFVWRNDGGEPRGVIGFRKECNQMTGQVIMECDAFYVLDKEALQGLINHVASYSSYFNRVRIPMPVDQALQRILPEVSMKDFKREIKFNGMGRVLNVEKALWMARYVGSGEISIKIHDTYIEENNRSFKVTFRDGKCCDVTHTDAHDIALEISEFSRMLIGYVDAYEIVDKKIKQVFYPKKNFICDFF